MQARSNRSGNGLFAAREFAKGERVLTIPQELLLTRSVAVKMLEFDLGDESQVESRVEQACIILDASVAILALFMVFARADGECGASHWREYVLRLPVEHLSGVNVNLEGVNVVGHRLRELSRLSKRIRWIQDEAKMVYDTLGLWDEVKSLQEWLDTVAIAASRIHHVWVWDEAYKAKWVKEPALVPMADMMNTDSEEHVNVRCHSNATTRGFDCVALTR